MRAVDKPDKQWLFVATVSRQAWKAELSVNNNELNNRLQVYRRMLGLEYADAFAALKLRTLVESSFQVGFYSDKARLDFYLMNAQVLAYPVSNRHVVCLIAPTENELDTSIRYLQATVGADRVRVEICAAWSLWFPWHMAKYTFEAKSVREILCSIS